MKVLLLFAALAAGSLGFSACQSPSHPSRDNFAEKTHRTYNPETGSFEQSPPFGKQSNKPVDQ